MLRVNSDETLIARALDGRERAWRTLVRRYQTPIYNYCLRMTIHSEDALDLMQEVFLSIYKSLPTFRGDSQFLTWALKIAHYRAVDFLRRKKQTVSLDEIEASVSGQVADITVQTSYDCLLTHKENSALLEQLKGLKPEQRLIVELKFFQELTFEDIALQLNIPTNTAKTRLYSALRQLRQMMEVKMEVNDGGKE